MELEDIQKQVSALYHEHLKNYDGGLNLSRPHVPLISESYLKNRIAIIGQETHTWYRQGEDDLLNFYLKNYDINNPDYGTEPYREFIKDSMSAYRGKFWEFTRKLYGQGLIECPIQKNGYLSHCWLNLFSIEAVPFKGSPEGRPTSNPTLSEKIIELQKGLLFELLKILKPKIVIALTGRSLDHIFFNKSLSLDWGVGMDWSPVDSTGILTCKELAEVKVLVPNHPLAGAKVIRAYHPSYFMGKINANKTISTKLAASANETTASLHYQKTILDWFQKNLQTDSLK